ncbi:OLC1v1011517C1 [Oldenlandia corymbosa var. corymbosa]|uniref:OLC1v1011517C1 n=1 Tax=Oldenlandia corymbosa var. corymbosa TaxID=529605 RepID=A0AAV1DUF4_OLDCO|nr:OLC1v1011517C1 [Oldenlandia corymbosa var. corymbosa]
MDHDKDNLATKKVRNRDVTDALNQVETGDSPKTSQIVREPCSFKDSLIQGQQLQNSKGFHLEEVTAEPEDTTYTVINGMPSIIFADRVKQKMEKAMACSIVVRPLGRNFSILAINKRVMNLLQPKGDIHLVDLIDGYHIIWLTHEEDYYNALLNGPWSIVDHYITVLLWKLDFDTKADNILAIAAWIGKYLKVDGNALLTERGRYVTIAVELDLTKPLVEKVNVDGKALTVEYEDIRRICFTCGKYSHTKDECSIP